MSSNNKTKFNNKGWIEKGYSLSESEKELHWKMFWAMDSFNLLGENFANDITLEELQDYYGRRE